VTAARVTSRGAERWVRGHPWIYRSEVTEGPGEAGLVAVHDPRGRFMGQGLYSPRSEIRLRLLERKELPVDAAWWRDHFAAAVARRQDIDASACRLIHGEGDGIPSLVVDRYDRWLVAQILSAGLETLRPAIVAGLLEVLTPEGILLRNDAPVRKREGLSTEPELAHGSVPRKIEVREGKVRYLASPWEGQKTGAFLDQRTNRVLAGELTRPGGRALDCFTYHGSFALHLAGRARSVLAIEMLRAIARGSERFDTVVLDPPAFAKSRATVPAAIRGYREINLRAMRSLAPGGTLITASCSFHVGLPEFLTMLAEAAGDSGRRIYLRRVLSQSEDHPEVLTIPETGYLKGAVLEAE
jgi:23S rRNA (cytosine1962-C5)-methyltransferase